MSAAERKDAAATRASGTGVPSKAGALAIAVVGRLVDLSDRERGLLLDRRPADEASLAEAVRGILGRVRLQGDSALRAMARDFDGVELQSLEIPRERWDRAVEGLDTRLRSALERAARNIRAFHEAQLPREIVLEVEAGVRIGRRAVPVGAAGVYAPGGRAAYPSSVLMGVVPARAAGVREIVVCSPPGRSGEPPANVLAACAIAGATRLFALGGAGAIGALAYGTASVPRVDAIVGPGNRWVTEAKRQVAGDLRIDSPAGPSEVLVVGGPGANPAWIAAELVAQAEHDPDACVGLVTWSRSLWEGVRAELEAQVATAPRADIVRAALASRGALLLADDQGEALRFAEAYAAEHLALFTDDPRADMVTQTTAGTVFLGGASSVAFGDYLTGANHVLPTAGRARSFSGLSSLDFLRTFTWQEVSGAGAAAMAPDVETLANAEGLPAHATAALARAGGAERGP